MKWWCYFLQVRLVDRGAELSADGGFRKGIGAVQHWRPLHSDWHQAGQDQINWFGHSCWQLPPGSRNIPGTINSMRFFYRLIIIIFKPGSQVVLNSKIQSNHHNTLILTLLKQIILWKTNNLIPFSSIHTDFPIVKGCFSEGIYPTSNIRQLLLGFIKSQIQKLETPFIYNLWIFIEFPTSEPSSPLTTHEIFYLLWLLSASKILEYGKFVSFELVCNSYLYFYFVWLYSCSKNIPPAE